MSTLSRTFLVTAGCALAACGFLLGRWSAPRSMAGAERERPGAPASGVPAGAVARTVVSGGQGPASEASAAADGIRKLDSVAPSAQREAERLRLIGEWAGRDPLAALDYARKNLAGDSLAQGLSEVFTHWARRDPNGAWTWVTAHMPGEMPRLDQVIGEIGRQDPGLAARLAAGWAKDHPGGGQELYLAALEGMAYTGHFAEASQWVGSLPVATDEGRSGLVNFLAGQWARYAPLAAADWLKQMPAGAARDQAMMSLSNSWADEDPAAAAKFAFGLPAGATRQTALQQVVSKWLTVAPDRARQWVIGEGVHDDFDQAVSAIATQSDLMQTQPSLALKWAGAIIDDSVRFQCLNTVLSNLYAQDPASAENYIRSSQDLTPEQRAEFLKRFPPVKRAGPGAWCCGRVSGGLNG